MHTINPIDLLGDLNDVERKYAPNELYALGKLDHFLSGPRVSIVGSRSATNDAKGRASHLAGLLVRKANALIISGLAKGIDTASHLAAMENGGRTVAVIGTPLDKSYPPENRHLQKQIAEQQLLISQFAIGSKTGPWAFPARNRTMALLTDATVIVEAGESSGTESQAWEAIRLGRRVYLVKEFAERCNFKWVDDVLQYGAELLSIDEDIDSFIESLPTREHAFNVSVPQL